MHLHLSAILLQQAQGRAPGAGPGLFDLVVLLGPLLLIFYFLILRPQEKRRREQAAMLKVRALPRFLLTTGTAVSAPLNPVTSP